MLEINKNHLGDSIQLMKKMDPKSIQMVITSPPYNASIRKDNHKYPGQAESYGDDLTDEQYIAWSLNIFKEFERILKDTGVICYNMSYTTFSPSLPYLVIAEILKHTDFMIADTCVWKKKCAMPLSGHPNRLTRICEFVYIFCKKDYIDKFDANKIVTSLSNTGQKYFKTYWNHLETKNNDEVVDIHKATYSSDFCKYFIDLYSFPDSLVLDPFMGTGTSAIACIDLGRNWIGFDMFKDYIDHADNRIKEHKQDPTSIFTPEKVEKIKDKSKEPRKPRPKKEKPVEKPVVETLLNEPVELGIAKSPLEKNIKKEVKPAEDDFWS